MELNDLIFLGACSIVANMHAGSKKEAMEQSVKIAKEVWIEVLFQDKEGD